MELTEEQKIKKEMDKFNFGAFFLTWIWGIFNGSFKQTSPVLVLCIISAIFPQWSSLIILIILFYAIYCGLNGNKWAYYNKRHEDLSKFVKIQRYWAFAGLITIIITIIAIISYSILFVSKMMKDPIRMINQVIVMSLAKEKSFKDGNDIAKKLVEAKASRHSSNKTKTELYNDNSIILTTQQGNQIVISFYKNDNCSLKQKNCYIMFYEVRDKKLIHKSTTYYDEYGKSDYIEVK